MPTIKDVAKSAGVSPSTVSRVINNHPRISSETRKKVKESMKRIGYHPNIIARSLVKQKTNTLGLVMPYSTEEAFADPFYSEILRGIGSVAQDKEYSLLLITSNGEQEELEVTLKAVRSKRVDGLLILRAKSNDALLKELKELETPFVVVGRPEDEKNNFWVNNDNIESTKNLIEYLIGLGHKRIGVITGDSEYIVYKDRLEGYRRALYHNGIEYNPNYVIQTTGHHGLTTRYTKELLESYPKLTAIFAVDDLIAYGAILGIKELGLKVPDDISVVGFNNNPLSQLITPALTTVDINIFELGSTATKSLINIISEDPKEYYHEIVKTNIIVRDSCGGDKGEVDGNGE
ncbi:LacI family transcriptional regulator [Orenia metallireducens]|jgi:DNA-binding LacI/PurR family transcriptional regulator|uniref:Transcriptional regulator, LacI family n=1 Tax=Orenia metallireducens TaxID=1413210 RepID=A0A285GZQ1_9FIRM|nr:LacI family DNA-binding transcriptional regulator [Orenia metallireducens]PRX26458.1 LacI family transcriptional regulator [Orenia metallireducens]SNY28764.1 transcriptional regulator, LacI family [Orenia metallireducens]